MRNEKRAEREVRSPSGVGERERTLGSPAGPPPPPPFPTVAGPLALPPVPPSVGMHAFTATTVVCQA
eukprot:scaffold62829_cov28-Tisochrysis_lutea.AAC.2